ncbi:MAG: tRNA glutamyl-Q(34) synthetase GluQRS [Gammaproteobacteria bacterium RIFCSPHIGHO2_12_FULL_63_22]|nr:MAG: tRNA glutamyl-Q(34) synthetase GluQRS [Gammaproteobacteria bacterium RIFCSPHIGHO2_12_FULL_63_22]
MTAAPDPSQPYRGRFAPSPTGALHLGSLTAALGSWLMSRHHGGAWLVRIEDLDPPREQAGMADRHLRDLASFGLVSDEPVLRQSERSAFYAEALQKLREDGWAFECRCSRSDLAASGGIHKHCVKQPSGKHAAWRVRLPRKMVSFDDAVRGHVAQDLGSDVGDVVVLRADGYWAYQLAVVVDDALQGITQVVRGADLLDSTPRQVALQGLLGYPTPSYAHLPVVREANGAKLGKSLASLPLDPGNPLPALVKAFGLLGQDVAAMQGAEHARQALARAVTVFNPASIPAQDHWLAQS